MKIVIISASIFPKQSPRAFRATELAKYFSSQGHEVFLYSCIGNYDYQGFEKKYGLKVMPLGRLFFSTYNSDGQVRNTVIDRLFKRLFGYVLEYPDIELVWKVRRIVKDLNDIDLLVTIAMPHPIHWGAALAKKRNPTSFPRVWISDCGDPFMGNSVGARHPFYFQKIEDFWGRMTDYITVPIEEAKKAYSPSVENKIRVIPQGFDLSEVKLGSPNKEKNYVCFAYAGAIYPGYRDPFVMLEYLLSRPNLRFQFVVYTKNKDLFSSFVDRLGDKLILRDYVPRTELIYELSQMDFLVNIKNNSSVQSPSKLIDYYLTNRPIIDISTDFSEARILDEFLNRNYSHQHQPEDISQFDITNVGQRFLDLAK